MKLKALGLLSAAILGVVLGAGNAHANTIQSIATSVGTSGSNFTYNFTEQLTPNNGLSGTVDNNQSGLIILDFPGAISATLSVGAGDVTALSDWSIGVSTAGGLTGSGVTWLGTSWTSSPSPGQFSITGFSGTATFMDSGSVPNIVLVYKGSGLGLAGSQTNLIHLQVTSTVSSSTTLQSVSRDTANSGVLNEIDTFPMSTTPITGVPVPAAAWTGMSLLGCMGLLGLLRKRLA